MRARYQIVGAVSSRCGSLANIVPPAALRAGAAAKAFEAPRVQWISKGLKDVGRCINQCGLKHRCVPQGCIIRQRNGCSRRMIGQNVNDAFGVRQGKRDFGASYFPRHVRRQCHRHQFRITKLSAGCHVAKGALNKNISGAPRPRA